MTMVPASPTRSISWFSSTCPRPSSADALGGSAWPGKPSALLLVVLTLGLLGLCLVLFGFRLAERDLWSSHEARAAQDAQSILEEGRWDLPRLLDRHVEMQKPPLYYWLVAVTGWLRGGTIDAWAVRLPAAASALLGVLVVFGLGWSRGRPWAGFLAGAMLATAVHYTWLARVGRIDMPLALAVAVSLVSFHRSDRCWREANGRGATRWLVLAYLAVAVAILLKGPIGLVLPASVVLVHLGIERERRWPRLRDALGGAQRLGLGWGIPLLAAVALPWFLWANVQTEGTFVHVFFWKHNVERGLGGGSLAEHPWWYYGPQIAFDFLPWTPLALGLVIAFVRQAGMRDDPEARFGLTWFATILVVLSCARFKRADYLLPAYPGLALFAGATAERLLARVTRPRVLLAGFGLILVGVGLGWGVYLTAILPAQESRVEFRRFAAAIRERAPSPQLVLFFRVEAHSLTFHVGRPVDTLLEWENLDRWVGRPEVYYVVMPPELATQWRQHLKQGRLEEVLRNTDLAGGQHAHPLVLLRSHPGTGPSS